MKTKRIVTTLPSWIYLLMAMLGFVLAAMVGYTWFAGPRISAIYAPLQCASMELREHATTAHLWTEEILSGDTSVEAETVWKHLDEADWYAQIMLEGGRNPHGTYIASDDVQLRQEIGNVQEALADLRVMTRQRLEKGETSGPGTEIDQSYDSVFEFFVARANNLEAKLKEMMARDLRSFRFAQLILSVTGIVLFLFIASAFRQLERRRTEDIQIVREANESLERDIANRKRTENQRRESQQRLQRQNEVLVELAIRKILHEGDLNAALKEITQAASETLEVERVSVWLYNENRSAICCLDLYERSKNQHSEGFELAAADYPAYFKALEMQRSIAADDAHTDPRTKEFSDSYLAPLGISSMLDAPVRLGGEMVGVICHEQTGPAHRWTNEEQNFAGSMADLVTLALEGCERRRAEEALRKSEREKSVILDNMSELMAYYDSPEMKVVWTNKAAAESVSLPISQIVGDHCYRIWHHRDKPCVTCPVVRAFETGQLEEGEISTPDGRKWLIKAYPAKDEYGKIVGVVEVTQDITERKKAEEKILKAKKDWEDTFNAISEAITIHDKDFNIIRATKAAEELLGVSMKDILANKCYHSYHGMGCPPDGCPSCQTLKTGKAAFFELFEPHLDKYIELKAVPRLDENEKVIGIIHLTRDITERKRSELELKKLSAAVLQSANVIVITDPDGIIEYINPQFSRVTGYSLVEAIGKPMRILKSGKHDIEFYNALWQTIKSGKTWTGNLQNLRKNGDLFWERQTITPIFDEKGQIINFLSVGEDITAEIITQQKLAEADKMSAVGMLAAGVAHEFKNYLAGIVGNASFALTELEEEGGLKLAHETLSKVVELGERANDVAMSLLTYSKAKPENFNHEDLRKLITKSINLIEKEMKNLSIEIVTYFEDVPEVEVSASKIQQLLLNLLINAQHAIESDGVITVALLAEGDHVKIKVGDTGVGIPQKNLTKIFDPFFSTKGVWGKDKLVGTGMGLAICHNIAREHGGDLSVESIVGVGTTFILTLPVSRRDEKAFEAILKKRQEYNVLIFTLDKSIVSHYFKHACEVNARIMLIDNIANLPDDLDQVADLVICDAKFAGKVELYKMVEACRRFGVPYLMVSCGTMEYQLADIYEGSAANFKQLPDFTQIINSVITHLQPEV